MRSRYFLACSTFTAPAAEGIFGVSARSFQAVPFLSLWLQSVLAVICLLTANKAIPMGLTVSQSPSVFVKALFKSFDLCIVNSMSLVFASLCLMRVDASSFQVVARALNTPMSVVLSWLFLPKHSQTTAGLPILGCLLVTAGFMSTVVFDKISVSATGALFGFLASLVTAVHTLVIKLADVNKGNDGKDNIKPLSPLDTVFITNAAYTLLGLPFIYIDAESSLVNLAFDISYMIRVFLISN